jgi:glycosyltransferase involved in cell wall biosynthesis
VARVLHLLPHPGGGGEQNHRTISAGIRGFSHDFAVLTGRQTLPTALPGLLFRRPFLARQASQADLVHIDGDTAAVLSRQLVGSRPTVITTAGLHLFRRTRGPLESLVSRRVRAEVLRSSSTLCTSQAEYEELRALCGADAPLYRVYNGVPAPAIDRDARAEVRREFGIGDDEVVALMVARLENRKHPLAAAQAAEAARSAGAPIVLLVAGEGPLARRLRDRSGEAVRLLGFRRDVNRLIAASDFYLMPSEREGFSLSLLEAMAGGLPAVVGDGPGNPEAVGLDAGLIVPAGDPDALKGAILTMVNEPDWRRAAGERASSKARDQFSLENMLQGVEAAYHRALQVFQEPG